MWHATLFSEGVSVPNHIARRVGREVQRRLDALKIGQKMQDLPEELWHKSFRFYVKEDPHRMGGPNLRLIRLDPDVPSLTVTAYIFNKFVHPFENRFVTVREAARLQGFPDTHEFKGTLTSTQLQVGNAVPVPLARAVFDSVAQQASTWGYKTKPLTALSLFSGAGGLDLGATQTKAIATQVSLDIWADACASLQAMSTPPDKVVQQDIATVEQPLRFWQNHSGQIAPPDLVYGGPPCQAFSQAGKQKALADERGTMIFQFLRFVKEIRPAFFVLENVANLRGVGGGTLYQSISQEIDVLGYNCNAGVLLAADYGAPQLRRRLFFLGCQKHIGNFQLPWPTHGPAGGNSSLFALPAYRTVGSAFQALPPAKFRGTPTAERIFS